MVTKRNDVIICVKNNHSEIEQLSLWLNEEFGDKFLIDFASNSEEALSLMGQLSMEGYHPAIFMCDAYFDDYNGNELIDITLQLFPQMIPIMFAKSDETDIVLNTLSKSGLFGYVKTPYTKAELIRVVNRAIEEYYQHMDARRQSEELEAEVNKRTEEINSIMEELKYAQTIAKMGNWSWDIQKNVLEWSDEAYNLLGVTSFNAPKTFEAFIELLHEGDKQEIENAINLALTQDVEYDMFSRLKDRSLGERILRHKGSVKRDKSGEAHYMIGTIHDVTDMKRIQSQLTSYKRIIDKYVIVSRTDLNGVITEVSDAFCDVSGYERSELIGQTHALIRHEDMSKYIIDELWSVISSDNIWNGEFMNRRKDGSTYWVHSQIMPVEDEPQGYMEIATDITDKKHIEEISILDELTGLYNRRHFNRVFDEEFRRIKREEKLFVFLMADVDNFKKYNDTYGHVSGDEVLRQVANVFDTTLQRSGDVSFRLGGEEFGAIMNVTHEKDALMLTNKIKDALVDLDIRHEENIPYGVVTASFGLKIVTKPYEDMEEIYKAADDALYRAKRDGRNSIVVV